MKKKIIEIKEKITFNKKIMLFLIGLACIGILMGSFFTVLLSAGDKTVVKEYMQKFMEEINTSKYNSLQSFFQLSIEQILFTLTIWLLGISVIGIPIILFLYFSKAFVLGFSISSFLLTYKTNGIFYSFFTIIPHNFLNFVFYILLLNYALALSKKIVTSFLYKKTIDFRHIMKKYSFILLITVIFLLLSSLYETFILPKILKILFSFLQ